MRLPILALFKAQTRQPFAETALGGEVRHGLLNLPMKQCLRTLDHDYYRIGRDNWIFILKPRRKTFFHLKQIAAESMKNVLADFKRIKLQRGNGAMAFVGS